MRRTRYINLIALFINLGIVGCFFAGFYFRLIAPCIKDFKEFQNLAWNIVYEFKKFPFFAAALNMIASLFMMFCNGSSAKKMRDRTPGFFFALRYMAMGSAVLSLVFLGSAFLVDGSTTLDLFMNMQNGNLFFYTCIPVASIVLFLFFELEQKNRFRQNFGPLFIFLLYTGLAFGLMIFYNKAGQAETAAQIVEYNPIYWITESLLKFYQENYPSTAEFAKTLNLVSTRSLLAVVAVLSFLLPVVLWLINRIISSLVIGYEYVEVDSNDNVIRPINKGIKKSKKEEKPVNYLKVYHVSVNDRKARDWKVVSPEGRIKVFISQQEALAYASSLANKSKGIVRVHTALGKLKYER